MINARGNRCEDFGPIFDADNHYWETADAFLRYRDPKFRDRGLRLVEHDGKLRYFWGDRPWALLPGPGDFHPRPVPGSLFDYFAGREASSARLDSFSHMPEDHPEYFHRDARLAIMDEQGIEACWMFPSHGVCIEGLMQTDVEASLDILGGFNRWVHDEWGFAFRNRIFGVPLLTLTDSDMAIRELEWALERGARLVSMRHGGVFTASGYRSPADRIFDPFWARVEEAGITVALHQGQEESYGEVTASLAHSWGMPYDELNDYDGAGTLDGSKGDYSLPLIKMLMKKRLVHDHAAILLAHGLFERFPRLRVAFIEFGGAWVGPLLHDIQVTHAQNPGMFKTNPVDQFREHCWVAPFVEDDPAELAIHLPAERILFGSDWPHGEGVEHPRDFFDNLAAFSEVDKRRIMIENARELTYV